MQNLKEISLLSIDNRIKLAEKTTINDVIEYLACDEDYSVRKKIAKRENLSEKLINKLACDDNHYVRATIAQRKKINYKKFI